MNSTLYHQSPLAGLSGTPSTTSTINIIEKSNLFIYQLLSIEPTVGLVHDSLGIARLSTHFSQTDNYIIAPLAKGRWLLVSTRPHDQVSDPSNTQLPRGAYLVDLSHAYTVLEVSGPSVNEFMQKGCRINLNPDVFTASMFAQTLIAEVSVLLLKINDQPTYHLIIPSGYSKSFWQWIKEAAAEFGF